MIVLDALDTKVVFVKSSQNHKVDIDPNSSTPIVARMKVELILFR